MDTEIVNPTIQALEERAFLPFAPQSSDIIIGVLLGCLIILVFALGDRSRYLHQMVHKNSIGYSKSNDDEIHTSRSFWTRSLLLFQAFVSIGICIMYYLYMQGLATDTHDAVRWIVWGTIGTALFLLLKTILFFIIDAILFSQQEAFAWIQIYTDSFIFLGMGYFVLAVVCTLREMSSTLFVVCFVLLLVLYEIWLLLKAFHIFFSKKYGYFQLTTYLCTLEWIPLLILWKVFIENCATL